MKKIQGWGSDLARRETGREALRVELAQMLDVPRVRKLQPILCRQPGTTWSGNPDHREGSFPAGGKLVLTRSCLHAPQHEVADRERPALDLALMVAPKALLIAGSSEGGTASQLFDEVDVIHPRLLIFRLRVSSSAGRPERELGGKDRFRSIHQEERSFLGRATSCGPKGP